MILLWHENDLFKVVYKTATEEQIELEDVQKILEIRSQRSFSDFSLTG